MTIKLEPTLEAALTEAARQQGTTPDALAAKILREQLPVTTPAIEAQDEWERELMSLASDCGVSLSNESLGREHLYE